MLPKELSEWSYHSMVLPVVHEFIGDHAVEPEVGVVGEDPANLCARGQVLSDHHGVGWQDAVDGLCPVLLLLPTQPVVVVEFGLVVVGVKNVDRQVGLAQVGNKVRVVEASQASVGCWDTKVGSNKISFTVSFFR